MGRTGELAVCVQERQQHEERTDCQEDVDTSFAQVDTGVNLVLV